MQRKQSRWVLAALIALALLCLVDPALASDAASDGEQGAKDVLGFVFGIVGGVLEACGNLIEGIGQAFAGVGKQG